MQLSDLYMQRPFEREEKLVNMNAPLWGRIQRTYIPSISDINNIPTSLLVTSCPIPTQAFNEIFFVKRLS